MSASMFPVLRVARPTNDIARVRAFYETGLGLDVLFEFENHDGFDGIMLGIKGSPYHFEFTRAHGHRAPLSPSQDHLVVFYLPEEAGYELALRRMKAAGFEPVKSLNPYWDVRGRTFEDFEKYRVVLYNGSWGSVDQG